MAIASFQRSEIKYGMKAEQVERLTPVILRHMEPDEYCRDGKEYSVYNTYFDTPDHALIRRSLSKPAHKEKLRLRSYRIPASRDERVFLELKRKTAGVVHKRRAELPLREVYAFVEEGVKPSAEGYMNRQVTEELAYFLSLYRVEPAVFISYKRIAFFGKRDRDFRLTIDREILVRRESPGIDQGEGGRLLLEQDDRLMEIKVRGAIPCWLAEALAAEGLRRTSFSKYGAEYSRYAAQTAERSVLYAGRAF